MKMKERKQLNDIEFHFLTGMSDRQQQRRLKIKTIHGFYMRWCSLHKKRLLANQGKHE